MTTFDRHTDLNARGQHIAKTGETAEAQVWRVLDASPALFARRAIDPAEHLAKMERREAARRATDNLLR